MPTSKPKSSKRPDKSTKKSSKGLLSTGSKFSKLRVLAIAAVLSLAGIAYVLATHAATSDNPVDVGTATSAPNAVPAAAASLPNYIKGNMTFGSSPHDQYSPTVIDSDGHMKVATKFNCYSLCGLGLHPNYKWYIEVWAGNQWTTVRSSNTFSANGNLDQQCFDAAIYAGAEYRVKFHITVGNYVHGDYWVRGNGSTC